MLARTSFCMLLLGLSLLSADGTSGQEPTEKEYEEAFVMTLNITAEFVEIIESITDVATLDKAKPRLNALKGRMENYVSLGKRLGPGPEALNERLSKQHAERIVQIEERLGKAFFKLAFNQQLAARVQGEVKPLSDLMVAYQGPKPIAAVAKANANGDANGNDALDLRVVLENGPANEVPADINAHQETVTAVRFSADGKRFATVGDEGDVKLWNAETRAVIATLKGLPDWNTRGSITSLHFSPDGKFLYFGGTPRTIVRWSLEDNTAKKSILKQYGTEALSISNNGQYLATLSGDKAVEVLDLESDTTTEFGDEFSIGTGLRHTEFSPDDKHLLAIYKTSDGPWMIGVWEWAARKLLWQQKHELSPSTAAISADGKEVILKSSRPSVLARFDLISGKEQESLPFHHGGNHYQFSADRNLLLAVSGFGNVDLYDVRAGKIHTKFPFDTANVKPESGDFSIKADLLVIGDRDGKVVIRKLGIEAPAAPAATFRTWTSADGKFELKAKLVGSAGGKVELEREDGQRISVPAASLSREDNLFLNGLR